MTSFLELGVPERVAEALALRGITEAFPIQALALPPALAGDDVCGRAPTGSGKTLAFGIPLAQTVERAQSRRPTGLVLAPTRELAEQIHDEIQPLLKQHKRRAATFYGGVGFGAQLEALRRSVDVAVACPGRLLDLLNRGELSLEDVGVVVIDEADRMADMGFLPEVNRILDQVRPDRQTMLFSATLDGDVDVLVRRYQNHPVRCEVEAEERELDLNTHEWMTTTRPERVEATAKLISRHGSTVVFCRTKHGTDRVARQLKKHGVKAVPIHGGRSQSQRNRALAAFADGKAQALVATDVAARGIHVDDVGCVVHFDPAGDHKDYVHRSGRTARAGAEGVVVSLVTPEDADKVRKLQRDLAVPVTVGGSGSKSRSGQSKSRTGQSKSRSGQSKSRNGQSKSRSGQSKSRTGQSKSRSGQSKSRTGQSKSRSGQSKSRNGQSRSRNGPPKSRRNRKNRTRRTARS